ncbi:hypothetical protein P153DRAFT_369498 [Dothidotthia symphoricarpi CBS 119687]|uniref:Uncharacterized protein n=1 Tax=Dothidotthia symphoricarpi CBS 119687 TaxID=1392245 RepID=A0A6A6A4P9_9PLEO|nr:uncharacterized protein P153DRAFT_369498 [Dothidotthia symphoricarpi CBS 119687]KAF2126143.1 hypothetical protein P153DRAFT_369498 [Dothidotthia symphoricarpi CBS 119687]
MRDIVGNRGLGETGLLVASYQGKLIECTAGLSPTLLTSKLHLTDLNAFHWRDGGGEPNERKAS